jgi:hypothetical protein
MADAARNGRPFASAWLNVSIRYSEERKDASDYRRNFPFRTGGGHHQYVAEVIEELLFDVAQSLGLGAHVLCFGW